MRTTRSGVSIPTVRRDAAATPRGTKGIRAHTAAVPAPPPEAEHTPANCRAREMIVRVADKWSMYVIHVLADAGTLRFS